MIIEEVDSIEFLNM